MLALPALEDGEEETVLDFGIKKGMNKGTMINADLGIGTHDRFAERLFGGYFQDEHKIMGMASANNTNDRGFLAEVVVVAGAEVLLATTFRRWSA